MTHSDLINRLMAAYTTGTGGERARAYLQALAHLPVERLEYAVDHLIRSHDRVSPPSIARILDVALGQRAQEKRESDGRLDSEIRGLLPRLSSVDYWPFAKSYGVEPDRALYQRLGVKVPPAMDYEAIPTPEASFVAHQQAAAAMSARVRELYGKVKR